MGIVSCVVGIVVEQVVGVSVIASLVTHKTTRVNKTFEQTTGDTAPKQMLKENAGIYKM